MPALPDAEWVESVEALKLRLQTAQAEGISSLHLFLSSSENVYVLHEPIEVSGIELTVSSNGARIESTTAPPPPPLTPRAVTAAARNAAITAFTAHTADGARLHRHEHRR